ncbi:MAG: tetratricopeptide repeat protein [Alphaproteobacteria bacterium]|nr:tetratricopeptide repeat protein [Alphaproteobacteria bacterium]
MTDQDDTIFGTVQELIDQGKQQLAAQMLLDFTDAELVTPTLKFRRAHLLQACGNFADACDLLERAAAQHPDDDWLCLNVAAQLINYLEPLRALPYLDMILNNGRPDFRKDALVLKRFSIQSGPNSDDFLRIASGIQYAEEMIVGKLKPHPTRSSRLGRKLKIGYLSSIWEYSAYESIIVPLLVGHDLDRFEVYAYNSGGPTRPKVYGLENSESFTGRGLPADDEAAAEIIRHDRIDVLVPFDNFGMPRLEILANRPALANVLWYNTVDSMYCELFDAAILDPLMCPPEIAETWTERPFYIEPTAYAFLPTVDPPSAGPPPSLANGYITFGCLNRLDKIHATLVAVWAEILQAVPGSKMFFGHYVVNERGQIDRIAKMFEECGIERSRLMFRTTGFLSIQEFLAQYSLIDISLDTFPFNGGQTTLDALLMGIPLVCCWGDRMVSRMSATFLTHCGLGPMVAPSERFYAARAIEFAGNPDLLVASRQSISAMFRTSVLSDSTRMLRSLEKTYEAIFDTVAADHGLIE